MVAFLSSLMSPAMAKGDAIGTAQDMDPEDNEDHVQSLLKLALTDNLIQENTDLEDEDDLSLGVEGDVDLSTLLVRCRGFIAKVSIFLCH